MTKNDISANIRPPRPVFRLFINNSYLVMSLFRRNNNTPIIFDVIGLSDEEFYEIKKIVSDNGGAVEHCHEQPIKFIKTYMFIGCAFPTAKLYNIHFITDCVDNGRIVDPNPYRIGTPILYDDYIMSAFLHGTCMSCTILPFGNSCSRKKTRSPGIRKLDTLSNTSDNENISPAIRKTRSCRSASENRGSQASMSNSENSDASSRKSRGRASRMRNERRGRGSQVTFTEEKSMVLYLIHNGLISKAKKGLRVWQTMIDSGICSNRTARTLYNRFRKRILPNIREFGLNDSQIQEFQKT